MVDVFIYHVTTLELVVFAAIVEVHVEWVALLVVEDSTVLVTGYRHCSVLAALSSCVSSVLAVCVVR